jgi:hypothetical protein
MKDFILFCKLVQPSPSSLQLLSSCHHHRSCRPCRCPHPRLPPLSPSPLPSLLPSPLLARQPCHHLHHLAALTLLDACHPHCRHVAAATPHIVACPAPSLPSPSLLPPLPSPLSLLTPLVTVITALFVASAFTRPPPLLPSHCLGWGGGKHTDPVRDSTLATTVCAAIIVTAFAVCTTGWEGQVQRCAGFQRPADSLHQCGGAAVGVRVADVILLANQRRWQRWWWRWRANDGGGGGVGNTATK